MSKQDKDALAAGAEEIRKARAEQEANKPTSATEARKPSWRDFYDVHPAAEFFHGFSSPEQKQELADDIAKKGVIYEPIHTAKVPLAARPFVIDGISRLEAAESRGFQVVDKDGNWTGMLASPPGTRPKTHNHSNVEHKEIWNIVISLNNKRRHYTVGQRALIAEQLAKRARRGPVVDQTALMQNAPEPTVKQAAEQAHVSERTVHQVRKVRREAPEKIPDIASGKLSPRKAVSEIKKPQRKSKPRKSFVNQVFAALSGLLKRDTWRKQGKSDNDVRTALVECLVGLPDDAGKMILPETLTYRGKTFGINDVLSGRARLSKNQKGTKPQ